MRYLRFSLLLSLVFCCLNVWANHLVGGEFQIAALGNNFYDIQLDMYGDNATLGPGNEDAGGITVAIFDKQTNALKEMFVLPSIGSRNVAYNNPKCTSQSLSTRILSFRLRKRLEPTIYNNSAGYYITWERCCRNRDIVNIFNPAETGMVFYAEFPAVIKNTLPFIDSSPLLPPMPPDNLCVNQLYQYSMQATDPDGDQLVYSLSEPMQGHTSVPPNERAPGLPAPYRLVFWTGGANINNQIPGNPALTINATTGLLSVRPKFAGLFVFAVTVSEFRNGIKIGEVRRDMQVKINNCPTNTKPELSLRAQGATNDYQEGDTLIVTDATDFCFPIKFSDNDLGQTITLKAVPVNFSGNITISPSSGVINQAGQIFTTQICWPDCHINSPDKLFLVDLIAQDNACSASASDTLRLTFRIIPKPNEVPKIRIPGLINNEDTVRVGEVLKFTVLSTDSIDKDELTVTMAGKNFNPAALGMQFSPLTGKVKVASVFTWQPDCNQLSNQKQYRILFKVKDNSCFLNHEDTVSAKITILDVPESKVFDAPNIFTPNGDDINEQFFASTLPPDNCNDSFQGIQIFNRWGIEVYRSADRDFAWNGKNVSAGVYYYLVKYKNKKYKGWIEVSK
jgi:gliding motility-associated-like protein